MTEIKYHVQEGQELEYGTPYYWKDITVYDESNPGDLEAPLESALAHLEWLPRSFPGRYFRILQTVETVIASA